MFISTSIAQSELRTLARGKKSRLPINLLAGFVLNYCMAPATKPARKPHDNSVRWLKALYALEDPRD